MDRALCRVSKGSATAQHPDFAVVPTADHAADTVSTVHVPGLSVGNPHVWVARHWSATTSEQNSLDPHLCAVPEMSCELKCLEPLDSAPMPVAAGTSFTLLLFYPCRCSAAELDPIKFEITGLPRIVDDPELVTLTILLRLAFKKSTPCLKQIFRSSCEPETHPESREAFVVTWVQQALFASVHACGVCDC